jgi:hypothetical protein
MSSGAFAVMASSTRVSAPGAANVPSAQPMECQRRELLQKTGQGLLAICQHLAGLRRFRLLHAQTGSYTGRKFITPLVAAAPKGSH